MKILILGANGAVGSRVAAELITRGHSVIAGVHSNTDNVPAKATIAKLDTTSKESLIPIMTGVDVVVCAISSWKAPQHTVLSTSMPPVIAAMNSSGVGRIISISGNIAVSPGEKTPPFIKLIRMFMIGVPNKVILDSEQHIAQLASSSLDWVVIRPGIMTNASKSDYAFADTVPFNPFVSRNSVVNAIVDLVENKELTTNRLPFIT